jgi:hypothetical protein
MIKEMGIRFRPPGLAWDKITKYQSYKNTKAKYAMSGGKMRRLKK